MRVRWTQPTIAPISDNPQYMLVDGTRAGSTSQAQDFGSTGIKADVVAESTGAAGVTVDGVLVKDGGLGVSTTAPLRKVDINDASGNCLRLIYNDADGSAVNYADFLVDSGGDLTINAAGGQIALGGQITTSSVNGRNLVTDGDKLDLIEALADVTSTNETSHVDESVKETITQNTHGFTAGLPIRFNNQWTGSQANSAGNAEVQAIVESSVDANNFVAVLHGKITLSGLTANTDYFLNPTATGYTSTKPSVAGQIIKPLFHSVSTTEAYVNIMIGAEVTAATYLALDGTTTMTGDLDMGGQDLDNVGVASVKVFMQDATPTAENADDLWYETDTNIWWFWNGTYWLSCQLFDFPVTEGTTLAATASLGFSPSALDPAVPYDLYIESMVGVFYCGTVHSGANHYDITLSWREPDNTNAVLSVISTDTPALQGGTWTMYKNTIDAFIDLDDGGGGGETVAVFYLRADKTGSPANTNVGVKVLYRRAHL